MDLGCGEDTNFSVVCYPGCRGVNFSPTPIKIWPRRFAADPTKSFFCYDPDAFSDPAGFLSADAALSLDVIYHLVEDRVYETYMRYLFGAARRVVVVYSTNETVPGESPHVHHRRFPADVA